jgi:predicted transcriptional regulator
VINTTGRKINSVEEAFDDRISKAIDLKKKQTKDVLQEIEANFRKSVEGHVEYHRYLVQQSKEKGDIATAIHHQVMMETYQSILKNYSMSGSYNRE